MAKMTRRGLLVSLAAMGALSGCGRIRDSRLNPFNWFGRSREETAEPAPTDFVNDSRRYVEQVVSLNVDPTPEGAIIRAVGLPPTQGFWDASLVRRDDPDPSRLILEFRVAPPLEQRRQGTQQSREIIVGAAISTARLQGIRTITVVGRLNQRSVRR